MFLLQSPGFQVNCVTVRATGKLSIQIFDFHISEFKLSTECAKYLSFTFSGEMHVLQKQRKEMGCDSHPSARLRLKYFSPACGQQGVAGSSRRHTRQPGGRQRTTALSTIKFPSFFPLPCSHIFFKYLFICVYVYMVCMCVQAHVAHAHMAWLTFTGQSTTHRSSITPLPSGFWVLDIKLKSLGVAAGAFTH